MNRLAKSTDPQDEALAYCPRGKDQDSVNARRLYWIERGNQLLREQGDHHLQWSCTKDGHYFIEPR